MRKEAISVEFCLLIPLKFKIGKKVGKCIRAQKARLHALWRRPVIRWNITSPYPVLFNISLLRQRPRKKLKNLTNQLIKQSNRCFESWTFLLTNETDLIVVSETLFMMTTFSNKKSDSFSCFLRHDLHPFFGWSRFDFIYG